MAAAGGDDVAAAMRAAYEGLLKAVGPNRQLRAACPRLFRDILAVLTGLRPAFMIDYGTLPAHNLAAAAPALAAALGLAEAAQDCCVVVLNDCCYLVRPKALLELAGAEVAGAGAEVADVGAEVAGAGAAGPADGDAALPTAAEGTAGAAGGAAAAGSQGGAQQQQPPPLMFIAFEGPQARWAAAADAGAATAALQALRAGLMAVLEEQGLRREERGGCGNIISSWAVSGLGKGAVAPLPVVHAKSIPGWRHVVPPTASGYLLGYPALYLCHNLGGAQAASRGLSSGSLCLHTMECQLAPLPAGVPPLEGQPLLGFSVPAELAGEPEWEACREGWRARLEQGRHAAASAPAGRMVTWQPMQLSVASQAPRPVAL